MPSNEIMSVEGQLVGMPLAGPESFSQQQLDYLATSLGIGNWTEVTSEITNNTTLITAGAWYFYYNKALKLIHIIGEDRIVGEGVVYELPVKYRPLKHFVLANPTGASFIDYENDTGKFVSRSGTNGYFSVALTLPCTGE